MQLIFVISPNRLCMPVKARLANDNVAISDDDATGSEI